MLETSKENAHLESVEEEKPLYVMENEESKIEIYSNGGFNIDNYRRREEDGDKEVVGGKGGNIFVYKEQTHNHFDMLRGKIFNLLEASITDEKQCEALKGLIRGFSNEAEGKISDNVGYFLECIGLYDMNIPKSIN